MKGKLGLEVLKVRDKGERVSASYIDAAMQLRRVSRMVWAR